MKNVLFIFAIAFLLLPNWTQARDDRNRYSIDEAMNTSSAKSELDRGYSYYFASPSDRKVLENHGEYMSNKKTNAFGKSDKEACQWAFLSAMLSFQDRIANEGGNAVINLRSYYKKGDFRSETEFECGSGALMAGVTLVGDVVTLAE